MKKPIKPKAPTKPTKPQEFEYLNQKVCLDDDRLLSEFKESGMSKEEFYEEYNEYDEYDNLYYTDKIFSLDSILEQANEYVKNKKNESWFYPNLNKRKYSLVDEPVKFSDLSFCMAAETMDWEPLALFKVKFRNKKYSAELSKYEKDLIAYEKKKKTYDAAYKKYEANQRKYLKYEDDIEKKEKISRLKKELKELQS